MTLNVTEIFYSLQGEGARVGVPSIFIRLQGCSAKHACYASGVRCDTEFVSGQTTTIDQILHSIGKYPCREIIWTGGEPLDQLTEEIVQRFKNAGYYQAIETSGLRPPVPGLNHITISPKVAEHVILKQFPVREDGTHCDELRWVRRSGQQIPQTEIKARRYFVSPHFNGDAPDPESVRWCIQLAKDNPSWNLSLQTHKLIGIE